MVVTVSQNPSPELVRRDRRYYARYRLVGENMSEDVERCLQTCRPSLARERFDAFIASLSIRDRTGLAADYPRTDPVSGQQQLRAAGVRAPSG